MHDCEHVSFSCKYLTEKAIGIIQNLGWIEARVQADQHGVSRAQNTRELSEKIRGLVAMKVPCSDLSISNFVTEQFKPHSPMLEPSETTHFCRRMFEGSFSHSRPSSYVPHSPWLLTCL